MDCSKVRGYESGRVRKERLRRLDLSGTVLARTARLGQSGTCRAIPPIGPGLEFLVLGRFDVRRLSTS